MLYLLVGGDVRNCSDCKYYEKVEHYPKGNCIYEVKFPDSTYARSSGFKRLVSDTDGRYCPCWEEKINTAK